MGFDRNWRKKIAPPIKKKKKQKTNKEAYQTMKHLMPFPLCLKLIIHKCISARPICKIFTAMFGDRTQ